MSRKKFVEDFGTLFGDEDAAILSEDSVLLSGKSAEESKRNRSKSSHGKNFASDLESFLEEAFEESFDEQLQQNESKPPKIESQIKKRSRRPMGGLDSLIRSTVEPSHIEVEDLPTRRITLIFDKRKLEKLKTIARLERTYLKDIIDDIVEEFLQGYESQKGQVEE